MFDAIGKNSKIVSKNQSQPFQNVDETSFEGPQTWFLNNFPCRQFNKTLRFKTKIKLLNCKQMWKP
jgi:hypothetical protein